MEAGVLGGSVLSLTLYNLFINAIPLTIIVHLALFADTCLYVTYSGLIQERYSKCYYFPSVMLWQLWILKKVKQGLKTKRLAELSLWHMQGVWKCTARVTVKEIGVTESYITTLYRFVTMSY
jgi:hypothetical protein